MPAEGRGPDLRQARKVTRPRRLADGPATPLETVRKLQTSLQAKAKAEPAFRFYALWDKVCRADVLEEAYRACRRNDGAPGCDGMTFDQIAAHGQDRWLEELRQELRVGDYRPQPLLRVWIPKSNGGQRPLGIPCIRDRVVQMAAVLVIGPIFEVDLLPQQHGFRPGLDAKMALRRVYWHVTQHGRREVVDADLRDYLDAASYCPPVHEVRSKSSGSRAIALMRSPFCLPRITWTALSSPRLTRCNTVWRETPSAFIASRMGMKPSPASLLNRAMTSWVNRMRHGAPGVSCSPGMIPVLSKRWRVEGAMASAAAAFLMVNSSPSACAALGSKQGISQCRRRLPTRPASKRWPYAVVRPWRLRMPAITASG